MTSKKDLLRKFLKGIETGDAMAASVVNEDKYIQHNPQTSEGGEGIAALFARIARTNPRVNFVRVFEDGDFAFAHNEYDFAEMKIAFEVFRFEHGQAVEHWDNIQPIAGPNPSGRSMIDGTTEITDLDKTETNRAFIQAFADAVLIGKQFDNLPVYVHQDLIQHDPHMADGIEALQLALNPSAHGSPAYQYDMVHRVLAEGNFVLCMCEGENNARHSGLYDLYRIANRKIAEHWNTVEMIPPRDQWKNENGKF